MTCIKKISLISCVLLVLIGFSTPLKAISGAELAYECLGPNQYKLILQVYRNCLDPIPANNQTLDLNSTLCSAGLNTTATLDTFYDVSGVSPGVNTTCNGGTLPGFEVFIYSATVTLPQTCEDWIISWSDCCRSPHITNLATTGNGIYVEAWIDSRYEFSSPTFTRDRMPYYNANAAHDYHLKAPTAYPNRMHKFALELRCPLQAANTCVTHTAGLSASQPLLTTPVGDVRLDTIRTELGFHPQDSVAQIAAVATTTYQIYKGDTVGSVQADFPVVIVDTLYNNAPLQQTDPLYTTGGIWTPPFPLYYSFICQGDVSVFSFIVCDKNGDAVQLRSSDLDEKIGAGNWTMFLNTAPPFRPDSVQVYIQLLTKKTNGFPNETSRTPYRLTFSDEASPIPNDLAIDLGLATLGATINAPDKICPYTSQTIHLEAIREADNGGSNLIWQQISGPTVLFSNTTSPTPFVTFPAASHGDSIVLSFQYFTTPDPINGTSCVITKSITIHYDGTVAGCNPGNYLVEGLIKVDNNANCLPDTTEPVFSLNSLLKFEQGSDVFYATADSNYQIYLDTGTYTVSIIESYPYWDPCPLTQTMTIDTALSSQVLNWTMQPAFLCPKLTADIGNLTFMRPCVTRPVTVNYANEGTIDATNAYVDVELSPFLNLMTSTIPATTLGNNRYRFTIGDLAMNQQGMLTMGVEAYCDTSTVNRLYEISAHIFPDSSCTTSLPRLVITDSCQTDTVAFYITNESASHGNSLPYWILEDGIVVDTGNLQLNMGQSLIVQYPMDTNKTYQLVVDPHSSAYAASKHVNCSVLGKFAELGTGFIPLRQLDYQGIIQALVVNSYDPNIKVANPVGYDTAHYIMPNHAIDYTIHFQNTGTDTAYYIRILDTLSLNLDINSVMIKGSSHAYVWNVLTDSTTGQSILEFIFAQANLVDSLTNEPESHGFIQYTIQQQPNLPNSTVIENSASIYFDINAPIKTNTTFHTVCDNCYPVNITNQTVTTSYKESGMVATTLEIYPNPTNDVLTIQPTIHPVELQLFTMNGVLLKSLTINDQFSEIDMRDLPTGVYWLHAKDSDSNQVYKVIKL